MHRIRGRNKKVQMQLCQKWLQLCQLQSNARGVTGCQALVSSCPANSSSLKAELQLINFYVNESKSLRRKDSLDNIGHWDLGITEQSLSLRTINCIVVLVNIRITDVFLVFRFCFVYDHRCVEIQKLKVTFSFFSSTICSPFAYS